MPNVLQMPRPGFFDENLQTMDACAVMPLQSSDVTWHKATVRREDRQAHNGHRSVVIWFTGLSGSGKSTLAHEIEACLHRMGCKTYVLDGDNIRHGLCGDLGFSAADRSENIRRVGAVAQLMLDAGITTLAAFISPFRADRERIRTILQPGDFLEIYCQCGVEVCEARDLKGLYQRARAGELRDFTGISSPYEAPTDPELVVNTASQSLEVCVAQVLDYLDRRSLLPVRV